MPPPPSPAPPHIIGIEKQASKPQILVRGGPSSSIELGWHDTAPPSLFSLSCTPQFYSANLMVSPV